MTMSVHIVFIKSAQILVGSFRNRIEELPFIITAAYLFAISAVIRRERLGKRRYLQRRHSVGQRCSRQDAVSCCSRQKTTATNIRLTAACLALKTSQRQQRVEQVRRQRGEGGAA